MKPKYNVIIIDDESGPDQLANQLADAFARFNKEQLHTKPKNVAYDAEFDVQVISNPEGLGELNSKLAQIDLFVIDRKFVKEGTLVDYNCTLLEPLQDLRVAGIRIVWTSFPDGDARNMIESMRLGAWDYINKTDARTGDACTDVIVSALEGLKQRRALTAKAATDEAGVRFVINNYNSLAKTHAGEFVALERSSDNGFTEIGANHSLVSLYMQLKHLNKTDRSSLHITQILP